MNFFALLYHASGSAWRTVRLAFLFAVITAAICAILYLLFSGTGHLLDDGGRRALAAVTRTVDLPPAAIVAAAVIGLSVMKWNRNRRSNREATDQLLDKVSETAEKALQPA